MKQSAIFLDRDGTIIFDRGYLKNPDEVEFFPGTFSSLQKLQNKFKLFIITNQSGISKGITSKDEVKLVNDYIVEVLKLQGIVISDVFCCPHSTEDKCICKKPNPHFILQAAKLYNLNLENSYIIGDHPSDVECGQNAGINSIYLLSGHGEKHKDELKDKFRICENIVEASEYILKN